MKLATLVTGTLLACVPLRARAQIGTLPILDSLPARGECRALPATDLLKEIGITRVVVFESRNPSRNLAVGVNESGRPLNLVALVSRPLSESKVEGENLSAFLKQSGRVDRGTRRYLTGGIPSSLGDGRSGGLLKGDTVRIERIVKEVLRRCGG